jgi:HD-GYP domain-containing protein (c-di-GMP phosphodiesterase class II)
MSKEPTAASNSVPAPADVGARRADARPTAPKNWPLAAPARLARSRSCVWSVDELGRPVFVPDADPNVAGVLASPLIVHAAQLAAQRADQMRLEELDRGGFAESIVAQGVRVLCRVEPGALDPRWICSLAVCRSSVEAGSFMRLAAGAAVDAPGARDVLSRYARADEPDASADAVAALDMFNDLREIEEQRRLTSDFADRLSQSYEETYTLFQIMRFLASDGAPRELIGTLVERVKRALPMGFVAVQFRDDQEINGALRGQVILAGDTLKDDQTFRSAMSALAIRSMGDDWTRVLQPDHDTLAKLANSEVISEPIAYCGRVIGVLVAGQKHGRDAVIASPEMQFLEAVADLLGTFHENINRFEEQRAMSMGVLKALTSSIDAKDPYTRGHSERVAQLSHAISLQLGFTPEKAERIRIAGLVHDVGKIGVPEGILLKQGRLTDDEFGAIKKHPEIGHKILRDIIGMDDVLPGVLYHHERFDGKGYPHGVSGQNIPLVARIIGIADTFDAMSSTRSYRAALSREKVLQEIERCSGAQFDPKLVEAFLKVDLREYDTLLERQRSLSPTPPPTPGEAQAPRLAA